MSQSQTVVPIITKPKLIKSNYCLITLHTELKTTDLKTKLITKHFITHFQLLGELL